MTYIRLIFIFYVLGLGVCCTPTSDLTYAPFTIDQDACLFPININGKYGYIDINGDIIVEPKYRRAGKFSCGLAYVWFNDIESGYINSYGQLVLKLRYYYGFDCSEGLIVCNGGKMLNYNNIIMQTTGTIIYRGNELYILPFSDGYALFKDHNGFFGYINEKGIKAILPKYSKAENFKEGLARVRYDDKWGFINKDGNIVITPKYIDAGDFNEGLAAVNVWGENMLKTIYIDKKDNIIVDIGIEFGRCFSEGLACIAEKKEIGGKIVYLYGYIDKTGVNVIPCIYENAGDFSEGFADVNIKYGKSLGLNGYINKEGKIMIEPKFNIALPFKNGLAYVVLGDQDGYINKESSFIWMNDRSNS